MSHLAGLRAKEIADLSIKDVLAEDGTIKDQIYLRPAQTKGSRGRTVLLPEKLRAELQDYIFARFRLQVKDLHVIHYTDTSRALFYSQKSAVRGFSPNTLAQWFGTLYSSVGIDGASSHSGRRFFATHLADNAVNPKVIQSTMGSCFRVNIQTDKPDNILKNINLPIFGTMLSGSSIYENKLPKAGYLVIGNESKGIREPLKSQITNPVSIPSFGGAESLNAAVATGIVLSHWKSNLF
jgi:hypothetical protein